MTINWVDAETDDPETNEAFRQAIIRAEDVMSVGQRRAIIHEFLTYIGTKYNLTPKHEESGNDNPVHRTTGRVGEGSSGG